MSRRKQLRTIGRKLEDLRRQLSVIKDEVALIERRLDTPAPPAWTSPPATRLGELIASWNGDACEWTVCWRGPARDAMG
jgi:hypothetical protein